MRREVRIPRTEAKQKVEHLGLTFHTVDGQPYWNEAAAYRFESSEITELESATNTLHELCLSAVEHVISNNLYSHLGIPEQAHKAIADCWETDPPAIYGRFDLAYDGTGPPKMLEYNADTPTSLLEAAVVQWHWLQEMEPDADQFNSIWEGLIEKWTALKAEKFFTAGHVHFGCVDNDEDLMTTAVMMDTARESGIEVTLLDMSEIGWDAINRGFVDMRGEPIQTLFKLYPWEWIIRDKFGEFALETYGQINWIEPIWKMILSNKAILPILWELFPDHPNLLPAYFDGPRDMTEYVRKPYFGREGSNVSIYIGDEVIENAGPYESDPCIYQGYAPLAQFDGNYAVSGSWVIDGEARGIGVRESNGPITEDLARFVPHYFYGS